MSPKKINKTKYLAVFATTTLIFLIGLIVGSKMSDTKLSEQFIEHGTETQAGVLNCIPVNMRCKGKLTQLFEFHRALQRLDRSVRIEQVELVNEADFGGEVSMQTKAFIYYESADEQG